ncbi:MAG: regulatory protein RecX [Fidelibacterota bacterium]
MAAKQEVTEIRVNLKRPDRRSIYLNGDYAFSISEGIFFERGITVGDHLTDEQIDFLLAADKDEKIKEAALRLLSYRPRSIWELTDRLRRKGWGEREVAPVIRDLEEKGYLDDREFANMLARDRIQRKFLGPRALKHELMKAGVPGDLIDEVLDDTYRQTPPESLIRSLLSKRGIDPGKPVAAKEKTRIVNLLKRRGFSWSDMEPVVSRLKTD